MNPDTILTLAALILFIVAAAGGPRWSQLVAARLACWVATYLV